MEQRMLIADGAESSAHALEELLKSDFQISVCLDGKDALDCAMSIQPDVVILDLMLPSLDGISLLHALQEVGLHPKVLATTTLYNDFIIASLEKIGVTYLMRKPCDTKVIADRARDLLQSTPIQKVPFSDPCSYISYILVELQIAPKLRGFDLLCSSIAYFCDHPDASITKDVYRTIASKHTITPTQVERTIRNALEDAWREKETPLRRQLFPNAIEKRPSNGTFISRIAQEIRICFPELGKL